MRERWAGAALGLAVLLVAGCAEGDSDATPQDWATARVTVDGSEYPLQGVAMEFEFGAEGFYKIYADAGGGDEDDCVPGLSSGMSLYGTLPVSVRSPVELTGQRLAVEFSGDGDDANLCFKGMNGLAGAEDAWVTISSVTGDRVEFSMSGSFQLYDEEGDATPLVASASGTAQITRIW